MKNEVFSVILTNYNGEKYINEAIDSIGIQDYSNIEVIVIDDGSKKFNSEKIEKRLKKYKNIKKYLVIQNKKNIGTVKTLEKAIKNTTGEYILFFASDDALYNSKVISSYVNIFNNKAVNVVSSQWLVCDEKLRVMKKFISNFSRIKYNLCPKIFFYNMLQSNKLGSGSTAYRKIIFEKYNFEKKYKLLEDWPFWIKLLKNNEKFYIASFNGLLHRGNGISGSNEISPEKKVFFKEMLDTFVSEVLPLEEKLSTILYYKILRAYSLHLEYYKYHINSEKYYKCFNEKFKKKKIYKLFWYYDRLRPNVINKIKILCSVNKVIPISFLLTIVASWVLFSLFTVKKYYISSSIIGIYLIIYLFTTYIDRFIYLLRKRKNNGKI